jgi:ABC-2 type transport system ATP-binding protein
MSAAPVIELHALTKDYGALRALDGASAVVPRGRVGLLGPNGAGKSTLVKCLLGLVRPSAGQATVLGVDAGARPLELRRRVGYVPEVDCHVPGMSGAEFVAYMGELCGMTSRAARARAHEVLEWVGLGEERYRPVDGYSFGMRQRVKLAQALVHDPELLLLDEPTNGLDPLGREQMLGLIRELGEAGIAILHSSHLLQEVERVCEHVLILGQGKVLAGGPLAQLGQGSGEGVVVRVQGATAAFLDALAPEGLAGTETAPGRVRVQLAAGEAPGEPLATRALRGAVRAGVGLRELAPARSTLEDVFLGLLAGQDPAAPPPPASGAGEGG